MATFTLKVTVPPFTNAEHVRGILESFFSEAGLVLLGKKKASAIVQFYQVRLDKTDKRLLSKVLDSILVSLGGVSSTQHLISKLRRPKKVVKKSVAERFLESCPPPGISDSARNPPQFTSRRNLHPSLAAKILTQCKLNEEKERRFRKS